VSDRGGEPTRARERAGTVSGMRRVSVETVTAVEMPTYSRRRTVGLNPTLRWQRRQRQRGFTDISQPGM